MRHGVLLANISLGEGPYDEAPVCSVHTIGPLVNFPKEGLALTLRYTPLQGSVDAPSV